MNATRAGDNARPYGPATPHIRRFLAALAGLSASDREEVVTRYRAAERQPAWAAAERALATAIAGSDREAARDAAAGPLLQLLRVAPPDDTDPLASLDAVAEPALAALLALLVRDVLAPATFDVLTAPFATVLPLVSITGDA